MEVKKRAKKKERSTVLVKAVVNQSFANLKSNTMKKNPTTKMRHFHVIKHVFAVNFS